MVQYLNRLFNIKTTEWPRVLMLYSMAFLFIVGITWGELNVQASFLFKRGVENLPQVIIANAIVAILIVVVYSLFVDRISHDKLLIGICIAGAGAIAIGYALLKLNLADTAYSLLYLLSIVVRQTFNLQWWTYVNSFYDTRAAKRIIPMLSTASRVAVIVAGQTMKTMNTILSSGNVVLVWASSLVIVALFAWFMPYLLKQTQPGDSGATPRTNTQRASFVQNIRKGYRYVTQSPFLRWLAASTLFMMLLFALLEYHTSDIFIRLGGFESKEELSNFLGRWSSWVSMIMLPFQLFAFSRLVGRMGLRNANLIFSTGTLAIGGALVVWPHLATASLGYLDRKIFRVVFRNPIDNLLYNAVPLRVKGRARAFIGGLIAPLGSLAGGGLLLLSQATPGAWLLPAIIGVTCVAYTISTFFVRKHYTQALVAMLEQEDFSFLLSAPSDLTTTDQITLDWLTQKLDKSASSELTIFMARLIGQIGGDKAVPILAQAARAEKDHARATIIDILVASEVRGQTVGQLYTEFVADPDGRVRRSAIAGLEQWAGPSSEQFLSPALELVHDPDIDVRTHVIPPLIQSGDFFYLASASQALTQLLADENPDWRARGVRVLGQVGDARFIRSLAQYLADPADQVRLEAAIAIESLSRDPISDHIATLVMEHVESLLNDPVERVRRATVTTLGHIGTADTHQPLVHFLSDPVPQIRQTAIDVLVGIGEPAIPAITSALDSTGTQLRKLATIALCRIDREQFGDLATARVDDNLHAIYHNHHRLAGLSPYASFTGISILQSLLREQNDRLTGEIFHLLAAIHDPEAVQIIAESIANENAHIRANAIEALESLTTPQTASLIAPLFNPTLNPAKLLQIGQDTWDIPLPDTSRIIHQLVTDPDAPWLRTVVAFSLGEIGASLSPTEPDERKTHTPDERKTHTAHNNPRPADLLDKLIGDSHD